VHNIGRGLYIGENVPVTNRNFAVNETNIDHVRVLGTEFTVFRGSAFHSLGNVKKGIVS
jgi:hypothetical protein